MTKKQGNQKLLPLRLLRQRLQHYDQALVRKTLKAVAVADEVHHLRRHHQEERVQKAKKKKKKKLHPHQRGNLHHHVPGLGRLLPLRMLESMHILLA